jgi:CRP/FNR family transcriptional regulator
MDMPNCLDPQPRVTCTNCAQRPVCLPAGLSQVELDSAEQLVSTRLRIRRGAALYRVADPFKSLYVLWNGSLKSTLSSDDGREQVAGFHMVGEMVGFDGLSVGSHACDVVALEDAEVCVFPYDRIEDAAAPLALRRHIYRLMSREIVRKHALMLMLGSMQAHQRLATFLLDLAERFGALGYSRKEFMLRMTRAEIGSFLGITLETVSRVLSQFVRDGLIDLQHITQVRLIDPEGLRRLAALAPPGRSERAPGQTDASRARAARSRPDAQAAGEVREQAFA